MDRERAAGRDSAEGRRGGLGDFVSALPPEITSRIFSGLDVESLCHASVTCKGWHRIIDSNERLWRRHCLAVLAVCQREIDCDRGNGYSWKITLLRNYWKSKRKACSIQWMSTRGEGGVLEAELER
ncbi:unnamed protein product [Coccothraustes coccothraustes]